MSRPRGARRAVRGFASARGAWERAFNGGGEVLGEVVLVLGGVGRVRGVCAVRVWCYGFDCDCEWFLF